MTTWAHLPNAQHIDRVLAHLKQHPDRWSAAWGAAKSAARDAAWGAARGAARDAAWGAARDAAWDAARGAAWGATWDAARDAAWAAAMGAARDAVRDAAGDAIRGAARDAARSAAWDAIAALVAWDDCAYLLDHAPDFLRAQINLVGDHRAVLLLPAVIAMRET